MRRRPLRIPLEDVNHLPPPRPYGKEVLDGQITIEPPPPGRQSNYHIPTAYTRRQVEMMTAFGLKREEVAYIVGISDVTLDKHYGAEMKHGTTKVTVQMGQRLVDIALRGTGKESITALIFWLKTRGGWVEPAGTQRHIVQGDPDNPILVNHELTALTNEERVARVLQLLNARRVAEPGLAFAERLDSVATAARAPDPSILQLS